MEMTWIWVSQLWVYVGMYASFVRGRYAATYFHPRLTSNKILLRVSLKHTRWDAYDIYLILMEVFQSSLLRSVFNFCRLHFKVYAVWIWPAVKEGMHSLENEASTISWYTELSWNLDRRFRAPRQNRHEGRESTPVSKLLVFHPGARCDLIVMIVFPVFALL